MNRKEELQILIEDMLGKAKFKQGSLIAEQKRCGEAIQVYIKNHLGVEAIFRVEIAPSRTTIGVKTTDDEFFGEVSITHPAYKRDFFEMGWYGSNAKESDTKHLVYLEVCGMIARDMRTNGHLMAMIKKFLPHIIKLDAETSDLTWKLRDLRTELEKIEEEEALAKIVSDGGLKLDEPQAWWLRERDSVKFGRGKTHVREVKIGAVTDKTITLHYINLLGEEADAIRMPIGEAKGQLLSLYKQNLENVNKAVKTE